MVDAIGVTNGTSLMQVVAIAGECGVKSNKIIPASESPYGLPVVNGQIIGLGDRRTLERIARAVEPADRPCWWCGAGFGADCTSSWGVIIKGKRVTLHTRCFHDWRRVERHIQMTGCAMCAMGFECDEGRMVA